MHDLTATTERPWHSEPTETALELCRSSARLDGRTIIASSHRASGDARLSTGYGGVAIHTP